VVSAAFGSSAMEIPNVKALLARLAKLDAENRAAIAEFYDDAGAERSAPMRAGT
jgi:hypothetical protein